MLAKLVVLALVVPAALVACSSFTEADETSLADASTTDGADAALTDLGVVETAQTPDAPAGTVGCRGAPDCQRTVFLTSGTVTGSAMGGLGGADSLCNMLAANSKHPSVSGRTFMAWLSTTKNTATDRLTHGTQAYVTPDGVPVAADWPHFAANTHQVAIGVDENGNVGTALGVGVWTGTHDDGSVASNTCADWTASGNGEKGLVTADTTWSGGGFDDCAVGRHLYCIEY